uniref:Uncharacterized protein n=1 Tax=Romanomermis culicivorax TaxID=13658 RepID=A0A915K5F9_ROMCU
MGKANMIGKASCLSTVDLDRTFIDYSRLLSGSLYCLSLITSLWSSIFYIFGLVEERQIFNSLQESRKFVNHKNSDFDTQTAKITFLNSFFSLMTLKKLSELYSVAEERSKYRQRKKPSTVLPYLISLNLISSLIILILGSILENLKAKNLTDLQICWPQICGLFGLMSTIVSLMSLSSTEFYVELATVMCIVTSTVSLKSVDYGIVAYFPVDVRDYVEFSKTYPVDIIVIDDESLTFKDEPRLRFLLHLSLLIFLFLLFIFNATLALSLGSIQELWVLERSIQNKRKFLTADRSFKSNRKIFGCLHAFCGLGVLCLALSGLWPWLAAKNYGNGTGHFWLGCLFLAAGLLTSGRPRTMIVATFTTTILCFILSLENGLFSVNMVFSTFRKLNRLLTENEEVGLGRVDYQSRRKFTKHQETEDRDPGQGALVLYIIQCMVFFMEFIIASCILWRFGPCLKNLEWPGEPSQKRLYCSPYKNKMLVLLAIGHLPYALTTLSMTVLAETTTAWTWLVTQPLNFTTNGSVILICGIVQLVVKKRRIVFLISSILNTVASTIAFFVLAPYSAQLYSYWATLDALRSNSSSGTCDVKRAVLIVAILEFAVSVVSALICYTNYLGPTSRARLAYQVLPKITYNDVFATRTSSYGNLAWNEQRGGSTFQLLDVQQRSGSKNPRSTSSAVKTSPFTLDYNFMPGISRGGGSQFDPKINFWEYFGRNQNFKMT